MKVASLPRPKDGENYSSAILQEAWKVAIRAAEVRRYQPYLLVTHESLLRRSEGLFALAEKAEELGI